MHHTVTYSDLAAMYMYVRTLEGPGKLKGETQQTQSRKEYTLRKVLLSIKQNYTTVM